MARRGNEKNGGENGKKMTRHHILPRSRGGGNGSNILSIPESFHQRWHDIFGNMTPQETIEFIQIVFLGAGGKRRKKNWTINDLYDLQLKIQQKTTRTLKKREGGRE